MKITPTLNFGGQCREAIHSYAEAFGGEIACLVTYHDAGDPAYLPHLTEEQKDWVYHAELLLDGQRIIMSDHADIAFTTCYSNFLTLMYDTKEEVHRAWAAIREGSTVIYPLAATPYSAARVVFVDRFGIRWGLMTEARE
ncbi:MAG: VOC family protein [Clostridia bacterium]|nr:VOC family protein [Clostridia bacterium]